MLERVHRVPDFVVNVGACLAHGLGEELVREVDAIGRAQHDHFLNGLFLVLVGA